MKSINNQLATLFNYAVLYYDLRDNPCRKAGSIGKSKADRANDVVRLFTETFHKRYSVECSTALHHDKAKTNYISLTDIAKYKNPDNAFIVVGNRMRNHSTISLLGLWKQIHNPNFKPIEFDRFKAESGDNAFPRHIPLSSQGQS